MPGTYNPAKAYTPLARFGLFLAGALVCLLLWGRNGDIPLLRLAWPDWPGLDAGHPRPRFELFPTPAWDDAALAFVLAVLIAVLLPCLIARRLFAAPPSAFGLGVERGRGMEALVWCAVLLAAGLPLFHLAAGLPELQAHYPYARDFSGWSDFAFYELSALGFYASIEFFFRGYLLFGALHFLRGAHVPKIRAGVIAGLAAALPYLAWHLDKPGAELAGALVWAGVTTVSALRTGSVLHLIAVHWLWNVWLDYWVLVRLGLPPAA